jgi:PAS domain S-box-containing protein
VEAWLVVGVACIAVLAVALVETLRRDTAGSVRHPLIAAVAGALVFATGDLAWRLSEGSRIAHWRALLVMWAGLMSIGPAWWLLALRFAEMQGVRFAFARSHWTLLPALLQAFFFGLLLTNPWHGGFLTPAPGRSIFHAPAWIHAGLTYATLAGAVAVFATTALRASSERARREARSIALGVAVPVGANALYLALPSAPSVDPTMVAISVSSGVFVYWMTRQRLFALSPVEFSRVRALDSDALVLLDAEGQLLDANPASRSLFGALLDDPKDTLRRVGKALEALGEPAPDLAAGIPSPGLEFTLLSATRRRVRITTLRLFDHRERAVALLLRARDETELAAANALAQDRAALFEAVFDTAGIAVAVIDREGRVRFVNANMERIWGLSREAMLGASQHEIFERNASFGGNERERLLGFTIRAIRDLTSALHEDVALPDGRIVEVLSVPMRENGVVTGRLFLNTDVTARRRQERAALDAARFEDLSRLAGGVAHGFNNLLTVVLGNAELALLTGAPSAQTARHLREVQAAGERGAVLANQLFAYAGRSTLRLVRVELRALLEREVEGFAAAARPGIEIALRVAEDLPPVAGDAVQLSQVIVALLRNAAEALPEAGGRIAIDAHAAGERVLVRIRDDGCGMDAETLRRAFDPFFSTKPKAKGLGLAAARGIVTQHGGALEAESALGAGAVLTIALRPSASEARAPALAEAPPANAGWRGAGRILIVDDEATTLSVTRELAESLGFEVATADRPGAALELWRRSPGAFRLALIDATMPEYSGPELLRRMRLDAPHLPAVIYSGFTRESFELPVDPPTGFLNKPFSRNSLAEALRSVLNEAAQ